MWWDYKILELEFDIYLSVVWLMSTVISTATVISITLNQIVSENNSATTAQSELNLGSPSMTYWSNWTSLKNKAMYML